MRERTNVAAASPIDGRPAVMRHLSSGDPSAVAVEPSYVSSVDRLVMKTTGKMDVILTLNLTAMAINRPRRLRSLSRLEGLSDRLVHRFDVRLGRLQRESFA